jgi:hypothetical protein
MAATTTERIGGGSLLLDAYGGDFSSPTDLGAINEDGIKIGDFDVQEFKLKYGNKFGTKTSFAWIDDFTLDVRLMDFSVANVARMLGQNSTDVTDNSGASPKNESMPIGGRINATHYAIKLKLPQPDDPTLFDIFTFTKVKMLPVQPEDFKNEPRFVPLQFRVFLDSGASDRHGTFLSEYA